MSNNISPEGMTAEEVITKAYQQIHQAYNSLTTDTERSMFAHQLADRMDYIEQWAASMEQSDSRRYSDSTAKLKAVLDDIWCEAMTKGGHSQAEQAIDDSVELLRQWAFKGTDTPGVID